jgi:hypothetical protein
MRMQMERERTGLLRARLLGTAMATLCAVLAACPAALAQEGAPAGGGDAPQTGDGPPAKGTGPDGSGTANRDVEPFTPQRGSAGLQRRANLKALIATSRTNAGGASASMPGSNVRTSSTPALPGVGATMTQRNAIGVALPGAAPGRGIAGIPTPAGSKPAGIGTPSSNVIGAIHHASLPNAGLPSRGAVVNGTTMGRGSSGPGYIGGPAKDHSGINGTLMSPKR